MPIDGLRLRLVKLAIKQTQAGNSTTNPPAPTSRDHCPQKTPEILLKSPIQMCELRLVFHPEPCPAEIQGSNRLRMRLHACPRRVHHPQTHPYNAFLISFLVLCLLQAVAAYFWLQQQFPAFPPRACCASLRRHNSVLIQLLSTPLSSLERARQELSDSMRFAT